LLWPEVHLAAMVGCMRNLVGLRNYQPIAGQPLEMLWTAHIEGAAGELAVAKHLNVFWAPTIGDIESNDVGPYQVRTNSSRRLDDMILRPRDKDERAYISVLSFLPEFVLCGWVYGHEGKQQQWLREGTFGRPPCYFVPRSALRPLEELAAVAA
jgi:hypothetical protein